MSNDLTDTQRSELRDHFEKGGKIAAIKLYRQWSRCSLLDAKLAVERLIANGPPSSGGQPAFSQRADAETIDDQQMDEILDRLAAGRRLSAIKLYRSHSGAPLKESKRFIDSLIQELDSAMPESAIQSRRVGCVPVVAVLTGLPLAYALLQSMVQ